MIILRTKEFSISAAESKYWKALWEEYNKKFKTSKLKFEFKDRPNGLIKLSFQGITWVYIEFDKVRATDYNGENVSDSKYYVWHELSNSLEEGMPLVQRNPITYDSIKWLIGELRRELLTKKLH